MVIKNHKLSTLSTVYLIVDAVILVAFLFLPWIRIVLGYNVLLSASGFTLPFKIFGVSNELSQYSYLSYDAITSASTQINIMGILSLIFYVIPIFIIIAAYFLFAQLDEQKFGTFSRLGCLTAIIGAVFMIIIRSMILSKLNVDTSLGGLESIINSSINSVISIGYGLYIDLIAGIVGLVIPYLIHSEKAPDYNRDLKEVKDAAGNLKNVFKKNSVPKRELPDIEDNVLSNNLNSLIKLSGGSGDIDIYSLPTIIGRNVQEADISIADRSVSRKHLQFLLYDSMLLVQDLGSSLGTVLAGEKLVPKKYYRIMDGDTLRIGNVDYRVYLNQKRLSDENESKRFDDTSPDPDPSEFDKTVKLAENKPHLNPGPPNQRISLENPVISSSAPDRAVSKADIKESAPGLNKTFKVDYNGGQTRFPTMSMQSASDYFEVNKTPYIVGSDEERVDHAIRRIGVSKQHFKVHRENDQFYITDLNSKNGISVNGKRITSNTPTFIKVGDKITVCDVEYRFGKV